MLVSACSSQLLVEGEAGDIEEDSWEASTADSCCVIIASERIMNEISVCRADECYLMVVQGEGHRLPIAT